MQLTAPAGHLALSEGQITVDDVLYALMSGTIGFSSIGGQLDRAADSQPPDWAKVKDKPFDCQPTAEVTERFWELSDAAEDRMMRNAAILRVVGQIARKKRIDFAACDRIQRFAKARGMPEGLLAIWVLMAFQRWAGYSEDRALAQVHKLLWELRANFAAAYPAPLEGIDGLSQVFRQCAPEEKRHGKRKVVTLRERQGIGKETRRARALAAGIVFDALSVLHGYFGQFHRARAIERAEERRHTKAECEKAERVTRRRRAQRLSVREMAVDRAA